MSKRVRMIMASVAVALMVIIFILITLQNNLHSDTADKRSTGKVPALGPMVSRPPAFDLALNLAKGTKSISDFKGRVIYLNFWASWCQPCLAELPLIESLQKSTDPKKFSAIFINMDHGDEALTKAKSIHENLAPSVLGHYGDSLKIQQIYNVDKLPLHILIDTEGRTAAAFYVPLDQHVEDFKKTIELLISELGET